MRDESGSDDLRELRVRVERLEAEVAELRRARTVAPPPARPPAGGVAPQPVAARSAVAAPVPRKERNPIVVVAAAGAAIFLFGTIFLLRFAIQQGWVGPEARFLFGIVVGGALTGVAARQLLRGAPGLGTALLAAGLGTLEFTFYVGALRYAFYGAATGFALAALGCVVAGALATRVRVQGAFLVAYFAALVAPFVFSTGEERLTELSAYALSLLAAAVLVAHLASEARRWGWTRWVVVVTQSFLQLGVAAAAGPRDEPALLALAGLFVLVVAAWIWRPAAAERPASSPTLLWSTASMAAIGAVAIHWHTLGWPRESFALPTLALAAAHLALVRPVRRGFARSGAEVGLIVLATALVAASIPIALDWSWSGPLWGTAAVGMWLASTRLRERGGAAQNEAEGLALAGAGLTVATTLRWVVAAGERAVTGHDPSLPFLNGIFLTAMLAAAGWMLLARSRRRERILGFVALEGVANVALGLEVAALVGWLGGDARGRLIAITLVWAVSGAAQWIVGLRHPGSELRRGLVAFGYLGLGVAAAKLVLVDLAQASLALRALVFLVAGGIFLGAALAAQRLASRTPEA